MIDNNINSHKLHLSVTGPEALTDPHHLLVLDLVDLTRRILSNLDPQIYMEALL